MKILKNFNILETVKEIYYDQDPKPAQFSLPTPMVSVARLFWGVLSGIHLATTPHHIFSYDIFYAIFSL